jgi:hypothetical protein
MQPNALGGVDRSTIVTDPGGITAQYGDDAGDVSDEGDMLHMASKAPPKHCMARAALARCQGREVNRTSITGQKKRHCYTKNDTTINT